MILTVFFFYIRRFNIKNQTVYLGACHDDHGSTCLNSAKEKCTGYLVIETPKLPF